ncbi:MAG: four helix bundle protein [Bacteroidetes bacterium]|jgi:four helix bundle protein|nr:four helix bundle protein [Bacteroidota bacterium]
MAKITRFEELTCWKASRELVKLVYKLSSTGNLARDFDTKSQLRRAALSMMNNIAEGFARFSKKEFIRFLDISQSSGAEVKSMIYVLEDLEYFDTSTINELHQKVDEARNLTLGLLKYLNGKLKNQG